MSLCCFALALVDRAACVWVDGGLLVSLYKAGGSSDQSTTPSPLQVREEGSHDELVDKEGSIYGLLVSRQMGGAAIGDVFDKVHFFFFLCFVSIVALPATPVGGDIEALVTCSGLGWNVTRRACAWVVVVAHKGVFATISFVVSCHADRQGAGDHDHGWVDGRPGQRDQGPR